MTPEEQVVSEIGFQPETDVSAPERKSRHAAFDDALRAPAAVNAEHGQIAPFGESHKLPAGVRDAVDLGERIGKERDARLDFHSSPPHENHFVVPPLGGGVQYRGMDMRPTSP